MTKIRSMLDEEIAWSFLTPAIKSSRAVLVFQPGGGATTVGQEICCSLCLTSGTSG